MKLQTVKPSIVEPTPSEEEATTKNISAYLEHVRLVHFALTAVAATVLYLVLTTWGGGNDARREVIQFANFLQELQATNNGYKGLVNVFRSNLSAPTRSFVDSVNKKIRRIDGHDFDPNNLILSVNGPKRFISGNLSDLRLQLDDGRWKIAIVNGLISLNPEEFKQANKHDLGFNSLSMVETSFMQPKITSVQSNTVAGQFRLISMQALTINALEASTTDVIVQTNDWVNARFSVSNIDCQMASNWFAIQYPALSGIWSEVKDLRFSNVNQRIDDLRLRTMRNRPLNLMGLELKAEHVGWVGPLMLLAVICYLRAYILELRRASANPKLFVIPWVGMMPFRTAAIISFITITVMPTAATVLAVSRLLGSQWGAAGAGLILLGLAGWTWHLIPVHRK